MAKIPYFPFYPDDWLSSSRIDLLTAEQERGYFRLLARSWNMPECTLPEDEKSLLKWSLIEDADALRAVMRTFFERTADGYRNPKLYSEWIKAQNRHEQASKNASARWKRETTHADALPRQSGRICGGNANQNQNQNHIKTYTSVSDEVRLSEQLLNLILSRKPDYKKPDIQQWAHHVGLLIRADHRPRDGIAAVIEWCQQDPFWQNNILSTKKLREKYDQLEIKMRSNGNGRTGNNQTGTVGTGTKAQRVEGGAGAAADGSCDSGQYSKLRTGDHCIENGVEYRIGDAGERIPV